MVTHHRFAAIAGRRIFYREAGSPAAPAVVLLHGTPASSHQYRNLIPALADRYHVIAPDYPGFGHSECRAATSSATRSTTLPTTSTRCWTTSACSAYAIYVQDYGAPVGWRLALRHPERIAAIITPERQCLRRGIRRRRDGAAVRLRPRRSEANAAALRDIISIDGPEMAIHPWGFGPVGGRPRHLDQRALSGGEHPERVAAQLGCSPTTAPTSTSTRACTNTSARRRCRCWRCGAATTRSSGRTAHRRSRAICRGRDQPARRRPLPAGEPAEPRSSR